MVRSRRAAAREDLSLFSRETRLSPWRGSQDAAAGRISKELKECQKDKKSGVVVEQLGGKKLLGTIQGPDATPYNGGTFQIEIDIPDGYPFEPPKMKFQTKIWHPNISSQTGAICLVRATPQRERASGASSAARTSRARSDPPQDILKDQWSPALTIKTALLSIQALLCSPEPDDPQDAEVANMYKADRDGLFFQTAKQWTEEHAMGPEKAREARAAVVAELMSIMGCDEEAAEKALVAVDFRLDAAVNALLAGGS